MGFKMIIFGYKGYLVKVDKPFRLYFCNHCNNCAEAFWHSERLWFTLFFLPIIPLWKTKPTLMCRICGVMVDDIECPDCQTLNNKDHMFCFKCNKKIET